MDLFCLRLHLRSPTGMAQQNAVPFEIFEVFGTAKRYATSDVKHTLALFFHEVGIKTVFLPIFWKFSAWHERC
jgi:hypothetical protein